MTKDSPLGNQIRAANSEFLVALNGAQLPHFSQAADILGELAAADMAGRVESLAPGVGEQFASLVRYSRKKRKILSYQVERIKWECSLPQVCHLRELGNQAVGADVQELRNLNELVAVMADKAHCAAGTSPLPLPIQRALEAWQQAMPQQFDRMRGAVERGDPNLSDEVLRNSEAPFKAIQNDLRCMLSSTQGESSSPKKGHKPRRGGEPDASVSVGSAPPLPPETPTILVYEVQHPGREFLSRHQAVFHQAWHLT